MGNLTLGYFTLANVILGNFNQDNQTLDNLNLGNHTLGNPTLHNLTFDDLSLCHLTYLGVFLLENILPWKILPLFTEQWIIFFPTEQLFGLISNF